MRFRLWMFTVATAALAAIAVQGAFQPLAQTPQVTAADAVTIVGSVVDENLAPVVGARVTLKRGGAVVSTATTVTDGSFRLARIAPGDYQVTAEHAAFGALTREIHVGSGLASLRLPLVLTRPDVQSQAAAGTLNERVTVSTEPPMMARAMPPPAPAPPQMKEANSAGDGAVVVEAEAPVAAWP